MRTCLLLAFAATTVDAAYYLVFDNMYKPDDGKHDQKRFGDKEFEVKAGKPDVNLKLQVDVPQDVDVDNKENYGFATFPKTMSASIALSASKAATGEEVEVSIADHRSGRDTETKTFKVGKETKGTVVDLEVPLLVSGFPSYWGTAAITYCTTPTAGDGKENQIGSGKYPNLPSADGGWELGKLTAHVKLTIKGGKGTRVGGFGSNDKLNFKAEVVKISAPLGTIHNFCTSTEQFEGQGNKCRPVRLLESNPSDEEFLGDFERKQSRHLFHRDQRKRHRRSIPSQLLAQ